MQRHSFLHILGWYSFWLFCLCLAFLSFFLIHLVLHNYTDQVLYRGSGRVAAAPTRQSDVTCITKTSALPEEELLRCGVMLVGLSLGDELAQTPESHPETILRQPFSAGNDICQQIR
jgi:hypothetical protein